VSPNMLEPPFKLTIWNPSWENELDVRGYHKPCSVSAFQLFNPKCLIISRWLKFQTL
jgi:hypothetical protein